MALRYWILLIALGAAFGASFAFNEVLLRTYAPLTVSALRVAIGAAGCWAWALARGRSLRITAADVPGLTALGVFQYAAPFAILPLAQAHVTSSAAGIANAMTPVMVVLVSQMWRGGERAGPLKMAGVLLASSGIPVIMAGVGEAGGSDPRFVAFAVLAPVSYGIALNLARAQARRDPLVLTTWAMTLGALVILPLALAIDGRPALPGAGAAASLLILALGLTTAAFLAMTTILPKVGPTNLSLVTIVAPLSAIGIGSAVFGDPFGPLHILGAAMVLAAVLLIDGRAPRALAAMWRSARVAPAEARAHPAARI